MPCYLVVDNAGGHGTTQAICEYRNMLVTKYNVTIIFQVPCSPYTNVLDLGVWMSLQSIVERKYFLKRATTAALTNTVLATWSGSDLDQMLTNTFGRLKIVLCNILWGEGGNNDVEDNRGVKHRAVKIETAIRELEKDNNNSILDLERHYDKINRIDNKDDIMIKNKLI